MFDFEKLTAYQKARAINKKLFEFLRIHSDVDFVLQKQLKRASISVVLNIAEGVGRFTKPDKRHFYLISRGSAYEVAALLQILIDLYPEKKEILNELINNTHELIKIIVGLMQNVRSKPFA